MWFVGEPWCQPPIARITSRGYRCVCWNSQALNFTVKLNYPRRARPQLGIFSHIFSLERLIAGFVLFRKQLMIIKKVRTWLIKLSPDAWQSRLVMRCFSRLMLIFGVFSYLDETSSFRRNLFIVSSIVGSFMCRCFCCHFTEASFISLSSAFSHSLNKIISNFSGYVELPYYYTIKSDFVKIHEIMVALVHLCKVL